MTYSDNDLNRTGKNAKLFSIGIVLVVMFLIYFYRLFFLQYVQGQEYRNQSKRLSSQVSTIPAQRGEIFDRNVSLPMVINSESFAVEMTPGEIPFGHYDTVATKLASILGISKFYIDKNVPDKVKRSIFDNLQHSGKQDGFSGCVLGLKTDKKLCGHRLSFPCNRLCGGHNKGRDERNVQPGLF